MQPASRLDRLSLQFFAGLNEKIASLQGEGIDVIRLDIGSPDLPPPVHVISALSNSALHSNHHGYQTHNATQALRQAWASLYKRLYSVPLDPDKEIVPLLGSKEGIFHLMLALVEPGDIVLIPDPGYLTYTQGALLAGGEPYYLPLLPERDFLPDLAAIPESISRRAKILWLNYPNNPTAAVASLEFFAEAVSFARQFNILLCHDAAYSQVVFDDYTSPSVLQIAGAKECAIEFNTLSKSYNMAGWRVGAALGQEDALQALYKLKTNADSGHFLPILEAATAALNTDPGWLIERNQVYQRRRGIVVDGLRQLGLPVTAPSASIYVWAPVPPGWSSLDFTTAVLEAAHVSLTPGPVFGAYGEGFMRIALTDSEDRITEAMQRLVASGLVAPKQAIRL
jgi:LL-diaminopimelate aminotransferase